MIKKIIAFCCALAVCAYAFTANFSEVCGVSTARDQTGLSEFADITECRGEGKVIAVIDTELNIDHQMFSAIDDKNVRYTKADISKIISSPDFNGSSDIDSVYVNSKIPYAFNYTYDDSRVVGKDYLYHGTHVSGIAAGNYSEYEGNGIIGAAPDAQIIFMSVGMRGDDLENEGVVSNNAILKAFEDALKMDVDVINLSIGASESASSYNSNDRFKELLNEAEKKGILICQSAGNDSSRYTTPDQPDISSIADYSDDDSVFSVANSSKYVSSGNSAYSIGNVSISYVPVPVKKDGKFETKDMAEQIGEGNFSSVEIFSEEEITEEDLNGKIVFLIPENEIDNKQFNELCRFISDKGAAGLILFPGEEYHNYYLEEENNLPCGLQYTSDGMELGKYKDITIKNASDISRVTENSSYGVLSSLILVPDITAPGTNIVSSGYDDIFTVQSGTSMSSPFMAGCCAVLLEYLEETEPDLTRTDRVKKVKNLLMNSAVPDKKDNIYTTPRQQGAGIVNLENLMNDKVIVTGTEGDAKISLGDLIEDDFEIILNISNISGEDVNFRNAELYLTTDSTISDEDELYISGIQKLNFSADMSGLRSVKAGETRTETVQVSLDAEQTKQLQEVFVNGFFVDGFIILSGADNCCDISVPLTGFHGDYFEGTANFYTNMFGTLPLITALSEMKSAIDEGQDLNKAEEGIYSKIFDSSDIYYSGNNNGFYDSFPLSAARYKPCYLTKEITDQTGQIIEEEYLDADSLVSLIPYQLSEGGYKVTLKAFTRLKRLAENPYQISKNLLVDYTMPDTVFTESEKDGKKVLSVRSSDNSPDGFVIIGKYRSDVTGVRRYSENELSYLFSLSSTLSGSDFSDDLNSHSTLQKFLKNSYYAPDISYYDFIDIVRSESGDLQLDYDITDFEYYSVAVSDKCGNMSTYEVVPEYSSLTPGTWFFNSSEPCLMVIDENGLSGKIVSMEDNSSYGFSIKKEEDGFCYIYNDHDEKIGAAIIISDKKAEIVFYDGVSDICWYSSDSRNLFFYSNEKIDEIIKKYLSEKLSDHDGADITVNDRCDNVSVTVTLKKDSAEKEVYIDINRFTGRGYYYTEDEFAEVNFYLYDTDILKGDTDHNGEINVMDLIGLKTFILNIDINPVYAVPQMDINSDGSINVMDLMKLKRMIISQ